MEDNNGHEALINPSFVGAGGVERAMDLEKRKSSCYQPRAPCGLLELPDSPGLAEISHDTALFPPFEARRGTTQNTLRK